MLHSNATDMPHVVSAAASRSCWAWGTLMDRFGGLVRSIARSYGLRQHDVDDVAQGTWLHLVEHIDELRDPEAIAGWLATTARRESLAVLRRSSREGPTAELVEVDHAEPINEARLVAAERTIALRAGVEELPGLQRELITMMLSEPPPDYARIASTLRIPHGTIGPTRHRGLARLRRDPTLVALCAD